MTVITRPDEYNVPDLFIDVTQLTTYPLYLKYEGLNFAGSIKLKAAVQMIDLAEEEGRLSPGSTIVESSSGNLGVALSLVAASRGYRFHCVTDSRCNLATRQLMVALGATVEVVCHPHPVHGLLGARLDRVGQVVADDPMAVWLNQYQHVGNPQAHYLTTGPEILARFPDVGTVFIGVGTAGTLMGVSQFLREHSPATRIVGVDAAGSVTFGGSPATRHIPGLGAGVQPPRFRLSALDDHVYVEEIDTVRACRALLSAGFLLGGSTGTVLAGAMRYLGEHPDAADAVCVALAPDGGERYLDTVYSDPWVLDLFGDHALVPGLPQLDPTPAGTKP